MKSFKNIKQVKLAVVTAAAALALAAVPAFAQDFHRSGGMEQDFHFRSGHALTLTAAAPEPEPVILLPAVQSAREAARR